MTSEEASLQRFGRYRRSLLTVGVGSVLGAFAGCFGDDGTDDEEPPGDDHDDDQPDPDPPDDDNNGNDDDEEEPDLSDLVEVGAGSYRNSIPENAGAPPDEVYLSADLEGEPIPTNNWWGSLVWDRHPMHSNAVHWSHPLVSSAGADGTVLGGSNDWEETTGPAGQNFAWRPPALDVTISLADVDEFDKSVVTGWTDWSVDYRLESDAGDLDVTLVRGSPFVYFRPELDQVDVSFADAAEEPAVWYDAGNRIGLRVEERQYASFGPADTQWNTEGDSCTIDLDGRQYFTVALLPEQSEEVLETFGRYAHNHIVDTRITWEYAADDGIVRTTYTFETEPMENNEPGTIAGLFPDQHKYTEESLLGYTYDIPRGTMETLAGTEFTVEHEFHGILPHLPDLGEVDEGTLKEYISDARQAGTLRPGYEPPADGIYWRGKNYNRASDLLGLAEHVDDEAALDFITETLKDDIENWLTGVTDRGTLASHQVFAYNERWGLLQAYPAGFGAPDDVNDHHFHYGYLVRAAAEIARHDPDWAAEEAWGGMVDLVIRDFANPDRDDEMFPFLRTFDPYSGHSWAGGPSGQRFGNNQESSSEAVNAYAAILQWAEYTGDEELKELAVFLYTRESTAAREYWFDEDGDILPDFEQWSFGFSGMLFDAGVAHTTWFGDNPEYIYGINMLPVGGHSLYLGLNTDHHDRMFTDALSAAEDLYGHVDQFGTWWDILWTYRALSDPDDAAGRFDAGVERPGFAPEFGTSVAHTYHWIMTLKAVGTPDPTVTANYPLATVFERDGIRTYAAYNGSDDERIVEFSDGMTLTVEPHSYGSTESGG